jgi:uncharacterized protein YndB with AHSA1/START domain
MKTLTDSHAFSKGQTRRHAILAGTVTLGSLTIGLQKSWAGVEGDVSHTAEAIHQEFVIDATAKRVYDALTDAKQFDKITQISGVMKSMPKMTKPTEISAQPGGTFTLFGGYITGRQLELVPNTRIVQVWRAGSWPPGAYSIARFDLSEDGAGTRMVFDHGAFPKGAGEHLANGWKANYWEPLKQFLA